VIVLGSKVSVQFSLRHCCCHSPLFGPCGLWLG